MFYFTYVLYSFKDKQLYHGFTNNLRERIKKHNEGKVFSTKLRRPLELIYFEGYKNKEDALEREKFFKTGWGHNYLKKVLRNYLKSKNLGG